MELESFSYVPQTKEFIHGNMYYRETSVIAGTLVIGCEHKKDAIAFLLVGSIKQIDGENEYEVHAPSVIKTNANSRRYAIALTDVTYATVTHTESNSLENIEDEMYKEYSINKIVKDDYKKLMNEFGINDNDVKNDMSLVQVDKRDMNGVYLDNSGIEGLGVFTSKYFNEHEIIGDAVIGSNKTILGRYINHSPIPNAYLNKNMEVVALVNLEPKQEITLDYRIMLNKILGGNK